MVSCGFPPTWELMKACLPTRQEKQKIARAFRYKDESLIYKWCEDPDGSGRPSPLDQLDVILDHARLYHPVAALTVERWIAAGNRLAAGQHATALPREELLTQLHAVSEKEAGEALREFTASMRATILGGQVDLEVLLKEVREAEMEFQRARLMIAAAMEAGQAEE